MQVQYSPFAHMSEYDGKAEKLSKKGYLKYSIHIDAEQIKYIRIDANLIYAKNKGTFPRYMFPLSYAINLTTNTELPLIGRDEITGERVETLDHDVSAFLMAVIEHLRSVNSEILDNIGDI